MHFPEGIPSSLAWFSLLGSRYLLYNDSLGIVNMQGLGFVYQGKRSMRLGPLERWRKVRKRRNFAFSGLPCHCFRGVKSSFSTFLEISLQSHAPMVTLGPPPFKSVGQPENKSGPGRHLLSTCLVFCTLGWAGTLSFWH